MPDPSARVVLSASAEASSLQMLRAVAGSIASRLDMPYDVVDEIRTAVDEAATLLLGLGGATLHLEVDLEASGFVAVVWIDADVQEWPDATTERSWSWRVIEGLCDDARFERPGGHPGVSLRRDGLPASAR